MKVLAVETATSWQSVAILDGETRTCPLRSGMQPDPIPTAASRHRPSSSQIPVVVPAQLDGLVVSVGPGSFTGLRVGLSDVLGIRTITQVPLVVVPTLEGMAWNLRGCGRHQSVQSSIAGAVKSIGRCFNGEATITSNGSCRSRSAPPTHWESN